VHLERLLEGEQCHRFSLTESTSEDQTVNTQLLLLQEQMSLLVITYMLIDGYMFIVLWLSDTVEAHESGELAKLLGVSTKAEL